MRKAELTLSNFASVVLAALGILIFLIGAYIAFEKISQNQEKENAQKFAQTIKEKIDSLQEEQIANFTLLGFKQQENNWYVLGWGENAPGRPDKCFFKSCVCVCPDTKSEICQSDGYCREVEKKSIWISTYAAGVDQTEEGLPGSASEFVIPNQIKIPTNAIKLEITKRKELVKIDYYDKSYQTYHRIYTK